MLKYTVGTGTYSPHGVQAGLCIHIHFLPIRIHQFFPKRIRIQLLFKCGSGSSFKNLVKYNVMKSFQLLKKTFRIHIPVCRKTAETEV